MKQFSWPSDGTQLTTPGRNGKVRIWNVESLRWVSELLVPDQEGKNRQGLLALAWSPDGKWIAAGGESSRIQIWDAVAHTHVGTIDAGSSWVQSLAWHKDSRRLASCSESAPPILLDALDRKAVLKFPGAPGSPSVAWSADCAAIVVFPINAPQPAFFDPATGKSRQLTERAARLDRSSWEVCPDGKQVVAIGNKTLRLYDSETGQLNDEFSLPTLFSRLAWSPQGDRLAALRRNW